MLSGSSGGKVGIWMRANSTDYDLIAERALHGRSKFKEMSKYFKRTERWWDAGAESEFHGFEGPLHTMGGRKYPLQLHTGGSREIGVRVQSECRKWRSNRLSGRGIVLSGHFRVEFRKTA
jgi:hypothetical protein